MKKELNVKFNSQLPESEALRTYITSSNIKRHSNITQLDCGKKIHGTKIRILLSQTAMKIF